MVHALEETHRVLRAGGSLIDLRPATTNRTLELELADAHLYIGEIDSSETFADHRVADEALVSSVKRGLLEAEHSAEFQVTTDLDSVKDLLEFSSTLRRSTLRDELVERIELLIADEEDDFIIHSRRDIIINRYRLMKKQDRAL